MYFHSLIKTILWSSWWTLFATPGIRLNATRWWIHLQRGGGEESKADGLACTPSRQRATRDRWGGEGVDVSIVIQGEWARHQTRRYCGWQDWTNIGGTTVGWNNWLLWKHQMVVPWIWQLCPTPLRLVEKHTGRYFLPIDEASMDRERIYMYMYSMVRFFSQRSLVLFNSCDRLSNLVSFFSDQHVPVIYPWKRNRTLSFR